MGRLSPAAAGAVFGIVAGLMYIGIALGKPGALILVYLTQLPLFAAGLWLGVGAATAAGITGTLVLLAVSDLLGAALFAALNAVPVTLLVRQALLARRLPDGTYAWYPTGLLTAWLTGYALAGMGVAMLLLGGPQAMHESLRGVLATVLDRMYGAAVPNRDEVAATLASIIPGVVAASWMVTAVINAALAQGVLARFSANWRPSPSLVSLELPIWLHIALGIAAVAAILGGVAGFVGINAMIALSIAFCLGGLAVLHAAVRRLSHPTMVLVCFYAAAALFGWPFLVVAVLGLLDIWLGLRRRLAPQGVNSDG
ncbi:MAG: DUF2232 domain-containing protein [Alphaproteobacteria bacterium]